MPVSGHPAGFYCVSSSTCTEVTLQCQQAASQLAVSRYPMVNILAASTPGSALVSAPSVMTGCLIKRSSACDEYPQLPAGALFRTTVLTLLCSCSTCM